LDSDFTDGIGVSVRIRWGSIRNKIIVWAFVPAAFILLGVALISLYAYQNVTERLVIERDQELTRLSAKLLATELANYTDPLSDHFLSVFDGGIVVFDANRKVLAIEPEYIEGWGSQWDRRISFRHMLDESRSTFSDVIVDGAQGEKVVVSVVPISGQAGNPVGWIAGIFRLGPSADSVLYRSIESLRRGESNCIYLVDSKGLVIYHTIRDYIGRDFSNQAVVQLVMRGTQGAFRTRDLEENDIVASFAPVPGTSWGLITEESWHELTATNRRYQRFLMVLLGLGVIVPIGIVIVGMQQIMRPINSMIAAAREIAGGNFRQRISASTGDELENLAEQFNRMATHLQASYDDLERTVADRTRELATLNTLAAVVSRSLDLEEILSDALDEALAITGMEKGEAFVIDEETQHLVLVAHRGISVELSEYTACLPLDTTTAGLAAREGSPIYRRVSDYPEGQLRTLVQNEGLQLVVSAPLMAKEKTVGAIDLGSDELREITMEEVSLLSAIGHQIGVAVENARLYEQAQQLAVIQERNRLARDLHDSVMQALYGVTLYAEAASRQLYKGAGELARDHLGEIRETAEEALREMRVLIFELRPPILKREGLAAALQARLDSVEGRVGLVTHFEADCRGRLSVDVEEGLYRVAMEALNNALKHARADRVSVCLKQRNGLVMLEILDDGTGFDPGTARECGGFGLRGMEERVANLGGTLEVHSCVGEGTRIVVEVQQ
jgi:signal transduction histidine kinase